MGFIKRYHEAPKQIFKQVQQVTYGDYALVHMFDKDPEYYEMFKEAVKSGRDVILDNSLFELREAFDEDKYAKYIEELRPTWYIVPDCWKDSAGTIKRFFDFVNKYPNLPGKRIGVAQGMDLRETAACYRSLEPLCDKMAFNLHGEDWYCKSTGSSRAAMVNTRDYLTQMSRGRFNIVYSMWNLGFINSDKPHHLLGTGLAEEAKWYREAGMNFIDSIDTSSPVACGMRYHKYLEHYGNTIKPSLLMCDHMDDAISDEQLSIVMHNIQVFDSFCNEESSYGSHNE